MAVINVASAVINPGSVVQNVQNDLLFVLPGPAMVAFADPSLLYVSEVYNPLPVYDDNYSHKSPLGQAIVMLESLLEGE